MRGTGPTVLTFLLVAALAAAAVWLVARDVPSSPVPAHSSPAHSSPAHSSPAPDAGDTDADPNTDPRGGTVEPPPPPENTPPWRGDETIDQRVVGEDGVTPVPGVTVRLLVTPPRTPTNRRPEPISVATTVTDAEGRFRFEGVSGRPFQVRIEARHRAATTWTVHADGLGSRRPASSGLAPGDLQVGRDLLVHFVVVDEHGEAVPRAVGELLDEHGRPFEPPASVTCDDRGRADWLPPKSGVRMVVFRAPGRVTQALQGWRRGGDMRVVMRAGQVIAGVVVDEGGHPVRDADVTIQRVPPLGELKVVTGLDGAFRFEALRAYPAIRVVVRKGGGAPTVVSTPTGREDVRIVLPPAVGGGTVRGVVLRPDGSPAEGAVVDLRATCDARGRFELLCSRDGDITVGARYGSVDLPMPPHRWHAEFGRADLHLPRGGAVGGVTVRLQPVPVSFVPVLLTDADDVPLASVAVAATSSGFGSVTDADGRAVVAFLDTPTGTTVAVGIGGLGDAARQRTEVVTRDAWDGPPERILVEDAPHLSVELAGIAKDEWDAVDVRAVGRERAHIPPGARVGQEPEWDIGALEQGEHLLMIRYPSGSALRVVTAGGHAQRLHVDVRRGATLRVTVTDADGETPRDVRRMTLLWERTAPWGFVEVGRLLRGTDGTWTGERLPAGSFVLAVDRGFLPSAIQPVVVREAGTNTARVTLPRPQTVSGQVRGNTSEPLGGCVVTLRLPGGRRPSDRFGPLATTDADGRFEVTVDPIAGAYLAFEREGHATRMELIDASLATRVHRMKLELEGTVLVRTGHVVAARLPGTDVLWEPYVTPSTISPPPGGTPLRRLPVGDVELIAIGRGGTVTVHTIKVVPGRTVVLDLDER